MWGNAQDAFNINVISPGGEIIPPIRLGIEKSMTYSFIYEDSIITIDSILVEQASGDELILFRLQKPTPGIWTIRVVPVGTISNGVYNLWLPIEQFLEVPVYFLKSTPYISLTEPAMAKDVISVSTYRGSNGSFYINSGRGYTRTGVIKPDLAAQGVDIPTLKGIWTGSSMAAAITAGVVAQFMQWAVVEEHDRFADTIEVKSYLIRGSKREPDITYPNRDWGYGKINIEGTFNFLSRV